MVIPAEKEELKEFQEKCLGNTKMVVEITLPNVCLFIPDKQFFEVLYNRYELLTLCLLVSPADNLCKQFGPRSGPTKCQAWSGYKLFDTLMVLLKEFFENVDFEKNQQTEKKRALLPSRQRVKKKWSNLAP